MLFRLATTTATPCEQISSYKSPSLDDFTDSVARSSFPWRWFADGCCKRFRDTASLVYCDCFAFCSLLPQPLCPGLKLKGQDLWLYCHRLLIRRQLHRVFNDRTFMHNTNADTCCCRSLVVYTRNPRPKTRNVDVMFLRAHAGEAGLVAALKALVT